MLLRARIVLPISRPPIFDGAVRVASGRVVEVGTWRDMSGEALDLGEVILMPGMVNPHCHLDYTSMAGRVPVPGSFNDWITGIMHCKNDMSDEAWRVSWLRGSAQCLKNGMTSVGNIETRPDLLPTLWPETPLRLLSFMELIVVRPESDSVSRVRETADWLKSHRPQRGCVGLSPHAPYTVKPDALHECVELARENDWRMAMHISESADEEAMYRSCGGPLFRRLAGVGRDMSDCGQSPVQCVSAHGILSDRLLAIHVNYLDDNDLHLLAGSGTSVVHCPRSHKYFEHTPFRFMEVRASGVNVSLGTDSLATVCEPNAELDMFSEMRQFRDIHPEEKLDLIVQMATMNGARALGWAGKVGEISTGAFADMVAIPFAGSVAGAFGAVVEHTGPLAVMLDGHWEVPPPSFVSG